jgi:hypothetical protein
MRVSAKKANSTTTDVVLEVRMTRDEAMCLSWPAGLKKATDEALKEHLKSGFRVSRVVGQ